METMEMIGAMDGNTKLSRVVPGMYWVFTLNNYSKEEMETLVTSFEENNIKYVFGEEVGACGTPHLQGFIQSEKKIRPLEKFKNKRIHWEKCKGSKDQNEKYCTKDGIIHTNMKLKRRACSLEEAMLFDWQKNVIEIIKNDPDDRTVYWIWEEVGKTGKSTFCKYLSEKYNAIPLEGKKNDILFCAATFESDIYVWDLERSMETYVSYGAIEKIKNGYYMCSKYESKPVVRASPHVFIFANFAPELEKLSKDRWKVIYLGNDKPPKDPVVIKKGSCIEEDLDDLAEEEEELDYDEIDRQFEIEMRKM